MRIANSICVAAAVVMGASVFAQAASINLPGALWDSVAQLVTVKNTGLTTPEGPTCDSAGNLYFSDHMNFSHTAAVIWKDPVGAAAPALYKQNLDVACGIVFDAQNRMLYGGWNGLWRIDNLSVPASVTVLAQGDSLNEVNDMSMCADGGVFFTGNAWDQVSYVYYRSAAGALKKSLTLPGAPSAAFPNGIEYVEEKQRVYLCLSQMSLVRTYTVDAQHLLTNPASFATVTNPDGIALDQSGNVYVASAGASRIAVYDSTGASLGAIMLDWNATNCAFGGTGMHTLYITGGTAVVSLQLRAAGRPTTGSVSIGAPVPRRSKGVTPSQHGRSGSGRVFGVSGQTVSGQADVSGMRLVRASDNSISRAVVVQ